MYNNFIRFKISVVVFSWYNYLTREYKNVPLPKG